MDIETIKKKLYSKLIQSDRPIRLDQVFSEVTPELIKKVDQLVRDYDGIEKVGADQYQLR